jgi:protein SCO1
MTASTGRMIRSARTAQGHGAGPWQRTRQALYCALAMLALTIGCPFNAASFAADEVDPHAHHHHSMVPDMLRTIVRYDVPDLKLVRDDGKTVALADELNDGRPVVLDFIYTSCTSVCPLTSQTLSVLQDKLGAARDRVHLVSISIDPEQDTPERLHEYARKFGAGPQWQHYTGTLAASQTAQRAFDVYRGNKMDHQPVTLVRTAPGAAWVRLDGFATADQMLAELRGGVSDH